MSNELFESIRNGDLEKIKHLINESLNTILITGAYYGQLEIVKYALNNGADINSSTGLALTHSIVDRHLEVASFLIDNGAITHLYNNRALFYAIVRKYLEGVKLLVDNGATINAVLLSYGYLSYDKDIFTYLLLRCPKEVLKKVLFNKINNYGIFDFIMKRNLADCCHIIDAYREIGVDIYDMIEHEI